MGFDHIRLGFDQVVVETENGEYREEIFKFDSSGTLEKYIQKANSISSGENVELTYLDGEIQTYDKKEKADSRNVSRYVFEDGEITKKYTSMYYDNESTQR